MQDIVNGKYFSILWNIVYHLQKHMDSYLCDDDEDKQRVLFAELFEWLSLMIV